MKTASGKRKSSNRSDVDGKRARDYKSSEGESDVNNLSEKSNGNTRGQVVEYDSPRAAMSSLLKPHKLEDFFSCYWEKQPLVVKRSDNIGAPPNLFSKNILLDLLKEHALKFVEDINVCRYVDGARKNLNGKGRITVKKALHLLEKEGATLQIHQPQRFVDELWKLMEKLECFFKCLVGANVYITPRNSQGLSPHYDDVEVFIIQLEGCKEWKLYRPPVELPREYSSDLTQEEIGEPTHSFTLYPGDLLYMPRGTVHQARTPSTSKDCSTHVTISTYQKHTVGDYLMTMMPKIVEAAMNESVEFRQGIQLDSRPFEVKKEIVKSLLEKLPEVLENMEMVPSCEKLQDYMKFRLPPFGVRQEEVLESTPEGSPPRIKSLVSLKYPDHVHCILSEDEEDDDLSKYLFVYSSVMNDRSRHMMSRGDDEDEIEQINSTLKFPPHYAKALEQLQERVEMRVSDLELPSESDKLNLVTTLWTQHLITVVDSS
ncbi:ribosomal oxygenase 2-like [Centruroides sculpturatus]|uniref:ribosomal oxygenase 2-like n=1 Tax=Centruroides sculpturatus TaxID=218467 RepID=UPI000C6D7118|nr:ribosomal oxygenase 2-like [Centruroides sculpturatus]